MFNVRICVNDTTWKNVEATANSMVRELDTNAMVIWDKSQKIYDIFDRTKPFGPQSQIKELGITQACSLYVYTPDYPSQDPSSIVPIDILKIRKFVLGASKVFNESKKSTPNAATSSQGLLTQKQQLENILKNLKPSDLVSQKLTNSARAIYTNLQNGQGHIYMLDVPELVEMFEKNPKMSFEEFFKKFEEFQKEMLRKEMLMSDPNSEEGQKLIQQKIDRQRIDNLYSQSLDYHPEDQIPVTMLYINLTINNVAVKAFIDSGAQVSIMSLACAQRCNLTGLIDKRFQGKAKGVGGFEKFEGKIHLCDVKVENAHFLCPFNIMANREMDLLIGLNTLRKHNCSINLAKNRLEFPDGTSTPFLQSNEIEKHLTAIDALTNYEEDVMDTADAPSSSK
ncbi:unnamed protein product [Caenorhabditis angaria]|uniref:Aspartic peptidase DDI1-type domain-containing protein n=1 Tax=Caenorhabditis angaria TaxID=860376 RepID=A0A9P1N2Y6_9PELO|nr:unnamed protein product [Caenorhabditis angaria]